ncbi:MAG: hypothetical protein IT307_05785 [Chloroflexi bacterium]|nr:hypothetical protein [Chloroflexota bacterium]
MESARIPLALEPATLLAGLAAAFVASTLSLHLFAQFGVAPAAELFVMSAAGLIARPRQRWSAWLDDGRRRMLVAFAATGAVGAGSALMLASALPFALGQRDLVGTVLLLGSLAAAAAMLVAVGLTARRRVHRLAVGDAGATGAVPARGSAASGAVVLGLALGLWGAPGLLPQLPYPSMSAFGLGLLGNPFALGLFAVALLIRPFGPATFGVDFASAPIGPGMLVGAGLAAFAQMLRSQGRQIADAGLSSAPLPPPPLWPARRAVLAALAVFPIAGLLLAARIGSFDAWTWLQAAGVGLLALLVVLLLVARQPLPSHASGVGAAVAVSLVGFSFGLPLLVAVLLASLVAAVVPLAVQTVYLVAEVCLRRQTEGAYQIGLAAMLGLGVALAVDAAFAVTYLEAGYVPPADRAIALFVAQLQAPRMLGALWPWLVLGGAVQLLGGAGRHAGLLLASGLVLDNPTAGWTLLLALVTRAALSSLPRLHSGRTLAIAGMACVFGEVVAFACRLRA